MAGLTTIVERGGRANYSLTKHRLAYDQRDEDGWFNIWTCDLDGGRNRCLTDGIDFWNRRGQRRHVGLPTWSHSGDYLLCCVEEIDPNEPASHSNDPAHHLAAQPGRGVNNSIALIRTRDQAWWWLWRTDHEGLGSMHPYLRPPLDDLIVFSRMTAYGGAFASWDIGTALLSWRHGEPELQALRFFQPIVDNDLPPMAEVNAWAPDGQYICVSGNPLPGQQQIHDDVFTCDLIGRNLVRLTESSGCRDEPSRYCEHLVYSPSGGSFAYMATAFPNPEGTEMFVGIHDEPSRHRQVTWFNMEGHAMYVPPKGGATCITAARPTWVDDHRLITTALDYPSDDPLNSGQGPIVLFPADPEGGR